MCLGVWSVAAHGPERSSLGPPSCPYSPKCVEGVFPEVRQEGFEKTPLLLRFIGDSSPYAFLRHVRCKGSAREHRNEEVKIRPRTGTKSERIAKPKERTAQGRIDEHERDGCRW